MPTRPRPPPAGIRPRAPRWTGSRPPSRAPRATEPLPHRRPDGRNGFPEAGQARGRRAWPGSGCFPRCPGATLRLKPPSALSDPTGRGRLTETGPQSKDQDWAASPGAGVHPHDDMNRQQLGKAARRVPGYGTRKPDMFGAGQGGGHTGPGGSRSARMETAQLQGQQSSREALSASNSDSSRPSFSSVRRSLSDRDH